MNILVYEYVLGEEFNENSSTTLINEARLVINHIIKDLSQYYPNSKISLLANIVLAAASSGVLENETEFIESADT